MYADVKEYVAAFNTCTCSKVSNQAPASQLLPLPVLGQLWSHSTLDFVTCLPPSHGRTTILTIIDRFSKGAHFIALAKLASAFTKAEILV